MQVIGSQSSTKVKRACVRVQSMKPYIGKKVAHLYFRKKGKSIIMSLPLEVRLYPLMFL